MESTYSKDKVSFAPLKNACLKRDVKLGEFSTSIGRAPSTVSNVAAGLIFPSTQLIIDICAGLECPVTEVMAFRDIEIKDMFRETYKFIPPENKQGVITYAPLREVITNITMWSPEKRTIQDFFDTLPRSHPSSEKATEAGKKQVKAMLMDRGLTEEDLANPKFNYYRQGLQYATRNKLLHDKPVCLAYIYDICKALGCTPDYVMSYK